MSNMNPDQVRQAENILGMDIPGMKLRTYIFAAIAFLMGLGLLFADQIAISIAEFFACFLFIAVRLRYLSVVELIQNYNQFKYGGGEKAVSA
jgi:hypothetical protein